MSVSNSFANHFLIAVPWIEDPYMSHAVIYVCEHHQDGTVGLMVNRPMPFSLGFVFDQLKIQPTNMASNTFPILFGGPIQPERGFVIHRPFGEWRSSLALQDSVTVTTSNDIIRAIASNTGPNDALVTLGFSGWAENQLEEEIINNMWLVCPYKPELLYEVPFEKRWDYAGSLIGVKMNRLSSSFGNA